MRSSSIDEIPQFFNVLKGEMSFIGPRPIIKEEIIRYDKSFEKAFSVLPGMSGLWQVSGRNDTSYEKRVMLDMFYIRKHNFWMDLQIILKTCFVMVKPQGAY